VYTVAADGSGLTKLLDFSGTIEDLKYGPDGRLALLATEDATKEVGATEAGTPIAGDLDEATPEQRIAILDKGVLPGRLLPISCLRIRLAAGRQRLVGTAAPRRRRHCGAPSCTFPKDAAAPAVRPMDKRQQIAARVSRDGSTVAFIGGIMSDFGSTGGDVFTVPVEGGSATNLTPALRASATALTWSCDGHLRAQLLAGDKTQLADLGAGRRPAAVRVLWSGEESLDNGDNYAAVACPSEIIAVERETFTEAPEIAVGAIGHWRNLTTMNAGLHLAAQCKASGGRATDSTCRVGYCCPSTRTASCPWSPMFTAARPPHSCRTSVARG
jgi:hypothetical protein